MDVPTRLNQKWWADHGDEWFAEYQRRRSSIPYYMIHEVFLSGYFSLAAPAKILEFGCGFCRHLHYLRTIPGLQVYGCDQSPTMLASADKVVGKSWQRKHLRLIEPLKPLPYEDKSFDIVFTASVLIHIHPDDVPGVIKELTRVAKWHVLHIENLPTNEPFVTCEAHNGCWAHPLARFYDEQGLVLTELPRYGTLQGVYRSVLDPSRPLPYVNALSARLLQTEASILDHLTQTQAACAQAEASAIQVQQDADRHRQQAERLQADAANLRLQLDQSTARDAILQQQIENYRNSVASLDQQIAQLQADAECLRLQLDQSTTRDADLQQQLNQSTARDADLQQQIEHYRAAAAQLQQQIAQLHADAESLRLQLTQSTARDADLQQEVRTLQSQSQNLETSLADRQTQLARSLQALDLALRQCDNMSRTESSFHSSLVRILERI